MLEISGPFLSLPVLQRVFPQGLEARDSDQAAELRAVYEEWLDNQQGVNPDPALHQAWIEYVLGDLLGFDAETLKRLSPLDDARNDPAQQQWSVHLPEHGVTLRPTYVVVAPPADLFSPHEDTPATAHLLVQVVPRTQKLDKAIAGDGWPASPAARMQELLHATGVRLGLLTNGEQWMLVDAPKGETTGYISWYAELWFDEPVTLRAFTTLLSTHRFFGVPDDQTLAALLAESVGYQQEVTDQLGRQVRHALELLVQAIDRADRDAHGTILADVTMPQLYEAAVTVMMRLVFLFSAEERGLLPLEDPLYAEHYAVSTLHDQLRAAADQTGEEVLELRFDAWPRLLATFRAVHGGVYHDRWHMPAYGGGLFDPARFAFLEGRRPAHAAHNDNDGDGGTAQPLTSVQPLAIDNRTVLHLLEALQYLQVAQPGIGKQLRRLSFRALDIEQIGHVYEGLLDHTTKRADAPTLGLVGSREPEVALADLEALAGRPDALINFLHEQTGRTANALQNALAADPPDHHRRQALLMACDNDDALWQRVLPWHGLIREDAYGRPVIINAGSVYVTAGTTRRASGTHYTPRSLTEPIVQHTLEPLVYDGPAQGKPRQQWTLRPAHELLNLKVCDMAMGSGAFLVQACRYLAERLVEAVTRTEAAARKHKPRAGDPIALLLDAADDEERLLLARRLVAGRCLYGVDKNPLAVEMAKLSLWLITMDKNKAFNFFDHALKCGDSLVGVDLDQLRTWSLEGSGKRRFETVGIDVAIQQMVQLRREMEAMPVLDIRDQQAKALKLAQAEAIAYDLKRAGDHLIMSGYNTLPKPQQEILRDALLTVVRDGADLDPAWRDQLPPVDHTGAIEGALRPFHWPLEFPEVFLSGAATAVRAQEIGRLTAEGTLFGSDGDSRSSGFDAFVGNPPFIGGRRIRETLGDAYRELLYALWPGSSGNADYCAFFFIKGCENLRHGGTLGLIATNTIAQGDTRLTGLAKIEEDGGIIYRAENNVPWPGNAAVVVNVVHIGKGGFSPPYTLDGNSVRYISSQLDDRKVLGEPYSLLANKDKSFIGSFVNGMGFVLEPEEAAQIIASDARYKDVVLPYLNGQDLNSNPDQSPSRYVINFYDWPRERTGKGRWQGLDERQKKAAVRSGIVPEDYPGPVAADYPLCYEIVKERVYPVRAKVNRQAHRDYWWHYGDKRPLLYATIAPLERVLVTALTSKYLSFSFVVADWVYAHACGVFAFEDAANFAILQSTLHEHWARTYASSLETRLRYTPADVFENFPFPEMPTSCDLEKIGEAYHSHRGSLMLDRGEGLTATYNRFHDPEESAADIARLRELHVTMDYAVAAAYGWQDLDLGHAFHETPQGIRYTLHEDTRREVLTRLLALNHARYEEEVKAGLHDKKKGKAKAKPTRSQKKPKSQMALL